MLSSTPLARYPKPFHVDAGVRLIQERIMPVLQGQPLIHFRPLAAQIDALTEVVTVSKPLPQPQPTEGIEKISRRAFLKPWSPSEAQAGEKVALVEMERPLHPSIRFGVSQALLFAMATMREVTVAELVAEAYGLSGLGTAVPIHLEVDETAVATAMPILSQHVRSLGYTTGGHDAKTILGDHAQKLQEHVRQVKQWISKIDTTYRPTIHLNICGGLSQLYGDDAGKILGTLFGLEKAAEPYPICIENPVPIGDGVPVGDSFLQTMPQLKSFLRMRQMEVQLAAGAGIESPEDVDALLDADAAHMVHLDLCQWGSVEQVISAIRACRQRNVGVMLSGGGNGGRSSQTLAHIALATQPDLVAGSPAPLHNEMTQTVAWLNVKDSGG